MLPSVTLIGPILIKNRLITSHLLEIGNTLYHENVIWDLKLMQNVHFAQMNIRLMRFYCSCERSGVCLLYTWGHMTTNQWHHVHVTATLYHSYPVLSCLRSSRYKPM